MRGWRPDQGVAIDLEPARFWALAGSGRRCPETHIPIQLGTFRLRPYFLPSHCKFDAFKEELAALKRFRLAIVAFMAAELGMGKVVSTKGTADGDVVL